MSERTPGQVDRSPIFEGDQPPRACLTYSLKLLLSAGLSWGALSCAPEARAAPSPTASDALRGADVARESEPQTAAPPTSDPAAAELPPVRPWELGGLPLLNYSSQNGFGYGAYAAVFHRKERPRLGRPYEFSIGAQYYATTGGFEYHRVRVDVPSLPRGMRFRFLGAIERWTQAIYLGPDEQLAVDLSRPEGDYQYQQESLWFLPSLRIPLSERLSLFQRVTYRDTEASSGSSSLLTELRPDGWEGGRLLQLELGAFWDARDTEPCTTQGFATELSLRGGHEALGSSGSSWGWNLSHRHWWRLAGPRLVLALRLTFDQQGGWVPFFQQHTLGGSEPIEIGGSRALRGFRNGRFRGRETLYGSVELRAELGSTSLYERQVDFLIVPFLDWGKFWDEALPEERLEGLARSSGTGWRRPPRIGFGAGPRLVFEKIFVLRFELAWGLEERRQGPDGTLDYALTQQFYAIAHHPF